MVETWLDRLFARELWLDLGRKRPIPHESWFQVAGYFFYYGHYYAGRCIEHLPPAEASAATATSWPRFSCACRNRTDAGGISRLYDYHQQYGTAFALMSLGRCRQADSPAPKAAP